MIGKYVITIVYSALLAAGVFVGVRQIYQGFRRPGELLNPLFGNKIAIRLFTVHIVVVSCDLFVIGPLALAHGEFVRHKTTRRAHYAALAPLEPGVFDTVLWNEEGEITEGTFGNIAMLLYGRWVTPPLACGLLPGVGRAVALRDGRVIEAVVRLQDLPRVQGWAFINSLRGWLQAHLG